MAPDRKVSLYRLLAEGVAIVASILLAFAIDAWWEARIERDREREILQMLLDDFDKTRAMLIEGIGFHTAVRDGNKRLLEEIVSRERNLSEEEVERLVLDLSWWDSINPFTTSAVNSVIASGDLAIIRNHDIRRILAGWPTEVATVEANRRQDQEFYRDIWAPLLREKGLVPQLSEIDAPSPGRPHLRNPVAGLLVINRKPMSSIIDDEKFHNVLSQKLWVQADIIVQFTNTLENVDRMTRLIKEELNDTD